MKIKGHEVLWFGKTRGNVKVDGVVIGRANTTQEFLDLLLDKVPEVYDQVVLAILNHRLTRLG